MTTLQQNHEAMAAWNLRRAKSEKEGLKKFRELGELWERQRLGDKEYERKQREAEVSLENKCK